VGGVDSVLLQLVEGLDKSRYKPHVMLPAPSPYVEKYEAAGAKVLFGALAVFGKPTSLMYYFKNLVKLVISIFVIRKYVKEFAIDLIHSHKMELIGGNIVGKWLQIPTIQTVHELPRRPLFAYKFVGYLNHIFNDKVIVLCERSKIMFEWGKKKSGKIRKIYNGIQINSSIRRGEDNSLRKELSLEEKDKLVISVARLSPMKGIEYLIEAAAQVKMADPSIKFVIVGDVAFDSDQPYKESLHEKVRMRNLSDTVFFIGLRRDVPQLLEQSDLFVLPSVYDIFPTVILEAMCAGLPIIATDVGGIPEMVRSESGLIVPPQDANALARAIKEIFQMNYRLMGIKGRDIVLDEFTREQYVLKTTNIYEELLRTNEKRHPIGSV
jgi:glycosyltransferase involved in cell wall biosynthesis